YGAGRVPEQVPVLPFEGVSACRNRVLNGKRAPVGDAGALADSLAIYIEDQHAARAGELLEEADSAGLAAKRNLEAAGPAVRHGAGSGRVGAGVALGVRDAPVRISACSPRPSAEVAGLEILVNRAHHVEPLWQHGGTAVRIGHDHVP